MHELAASTFFGSELKTAVIGIGSYSSLFMLTMSQQRKPPPKPKKNVHGGVRSFDELQVRRYLEGPSTLDRSHSVRDVMRTIVASKYSVSFPKMEASRHMQLFALDVAHLVLLLDAHVDVEYPVDLNFKSQRTRAHECFEAVATSNPSCLFGLQSSQRVRFTITIKHQRKAGLGYNHYSGAEPVQSSRL